MRPCQNATADSPPPPSLYSAFIYGLLYLFLTAYQRIFQIVYDMKPGVSGLPELDAVLGCAFTCAVMIVRQPVYRRKLEDNNNVPVPKWRLPEANGRRRVLRWRLVLARLVRLP